jgi:GT2 family glycosyltransferase
MSSGRAHSLVVVTWESEADLTRLVHSMLAHLPPRNELVVVDNASSDQPERALELWRGPTRFRRLEENLGFGAACNAGVEIASGEAIVLLNPDVELLDASLEALGDAALEAGALVGPRLINADRSRQPSASGPVVGPWPWIGAILPGALQPGPIRARAEPWRLERRVAVAWLTGACIAAPRQTLVELGPFDPAIELMSEDLDLCLRAAARGIPRLFAPELCRLIHHGASARAHRYEDAGLALAARNRRLAIARAYGPRRERRAWRAHLLGLRLRAVAKRVLRRDRSGELAELAAAREAASDGLTR